MSKLTAEMLRSEIADLEAELSNGERKLTRLRDLLSVYEPVELPVTGVVGASTTAEEAANKPNPTTKEARVRAEIIKFMRAKGSSVTRHEMLTHLVEKGLLGSESKPMRRLAIYLTKAKQDEIFRSDGSGNWFLAGSQGDA